MHATCKATVETFRTRPELQKQQFSARESQNTHAKHKAFLQFLFLNFTKHSSIDRPFVDADELLAERGEWEWYVIFAGNILDRWAHLVVCLAQLLGDHGVSWFDLVDEGSHTFGEINPIVRGMANRVVASLVEAWWNSGEVRGNLVGFLVDATLFFVHWIPLGCAIRQVHCKLHWRVSGKFICAMSQETVPDKPLSRFEHQFHSARHDSSLVFFWINGKFGGGFRVLFVVTVWPEAFLLVFFDEFWLLCSKHSNETAVRQHDFSSKKLAWCARIDCAQVHVPMWKLLHALRRLFFNTSITHHAHIRLAHDSLPDCHRLWFLAYGPESVPIQERCTKHAVRRRRFVEGLLVPRAEGFFNELQESFVKYPDSLVAIVVQSEFEFVFERLLLNPTHHCADVFVALFLCEKINDATTIGVELLANAL